MDERSWGFLGRLLVAVIVCGTLAGVADHFAPGTFLVHVPYFLLGFLCAGLSARLR